MRPAGEFLLDSPAGCNEPGWRGGGGSASARRGSKRRRGRTTVRTRLLDLLVKYSYRYDASTPFRLASGKPSAYYVDCKATTMRGEAADIVGAVFAEHLPPSVQAVGGLTMGSDPIA